MSDGKIAYEEDVLEVLKWEDVLGPSESIPEAPQTDTDRARSGVMIALRSTYFFGPTAQAKYDFVGKVPPPGPLSPWPEDSPGLATCGSLDLDDPNAPTYKFELKRTLWSLGRGYSSHLTNITQLTQQEEGLISVAASGTDISGRQGAKWELTVDPDAAYMVRSAKVYRPGQDEPTISIANSGIEWHGSTCVPQKSEWKDVYAGGRTTSSEFLSSSSQPDVQFLEHAQKTMERPYMLHTDVTDQRMTPELTLQYNAGELFPKGRRGDEQRILFEAIEHAQEEDHIRQEQPISQAENKTEDIIAAPTNGPDSAPSSPLGTAAEARRTKGLVARGVLVLALVIGIAYLSSRIRSSRSVNE
ncbi:MAG TPA: hypothetical protein VMX13_17465 [Sedimentisphaerales bacterium]|nr:hypothetical protein [Sedimentisphaerales bacterium]